MEAHRETKRRLISPRQFLRFTLRGLLVLVAVCSVWLGIAFQRAREQAREVAAIRSAGGDVYYEYQGLDYDDRRWDLVDVYATSRLPVWLLNALGVDFLHDVTFVDVNEVSLTERPIEAGTL